MKKPTGSVLFYKLETKKIKLNPNRKNRKKPKQNKKNELNRKKLSQTGKTESDRFEPIFILKN